MSHSGTCSTAGSANSGPGVESIASRMLVPARVGTEPVVAVVTRRG
jgi:hypothetical protein